MADHEEPFRRSLEADLVDAVDVAIEPVLSGGGVPLLPTPTDRQRLELTGHRIYGTGVMRLEYKVGGQAA